jgi:ABC-type nitrate/sulfonate/bicarbonate transport system substrate-binding protein/CheY-like chemotaxis protein
MDLNLNMGVLIADDSGFMRKLFRRNLVEIGFVNIIEAEDGAEAIEKLQDEDIQLVVSDWNMPKADGMDLLNWMRGDEKYAAVPFIMATAQGDKARISRSRLAGANGHIVKPFTADQLKEKIEIAFGIREERTGSKREIRTSGNKVRLRIGHIQITDHLVLGVVKSWIDSGKVEPKYFELETIRTAGWNPIQEMLEDGSLDGAFVLAPIAMDLFNYDVPIQLVSFAHKSGSIFVRSKNPPLEEGGSLEDFYYNKVVNIPHKLSIHNMLAHKYLTETLGMTPGVPGEGTDINVRFEVVPPIKMPQSMAESSEVAGFIVAEPIGSNAIAKGIAELQCLSSAIWEEHPCCTVVFQQDLLEGYEDAVFEFVQLLKEAGTYIEENKQEAADLAVKFLDPDGELGLTQRVLYKVLLTPGGIQYGDLYPSLDDLDSLQRYMSRNMGIGQLVNMEDFVNTRFADAFK